MIDQVKNKKMDLQLTEGYRAGKLLLAHYHRL